MMKRVFIFLLALALFIAITGGYGQIINSDWVARSFISADQTAEEYPLLEKNVVYEFRMNNGKIYGGSGFYVTEQKGKWITLREEKAYTDTHRVYQINHERINLDNVCAIYNFEVPKD